MAQHLNRLNNNDAKLWDAAFKRFCETGVWDMNEEELGIDGQPINPEMTIPTMASQFGKAMNKAAEGIMAGPDRFPGSRDWDYEGLQVPCELTRCVANHGGTCLTPTEIKIGGSKGCKAYKQRKNKGEG